MVEKGYPPQYQSARVRKHPRAVDVIDGRADDVESNQTQFIFGVPTIVKITLVFPIINTIMTLYMLYVTVQVWRVDYWSFLGKVHYSLITLAALVFIWWANYWNLLGWRF